VENKAGFVVVRLTGPNAQAVGLTEQVDVAPPTRAVTGQYAFARIAERIAGLDIRERTWPLVTGRT